MIDPGERLRTLRTRHFTDLTPLQLRCLAGYALAYSDDEIGEALAISPNTVRRHLGNAAARVLDPIGMPATRAALLAWFWLHTERCTAPVLGLVETGRFVDRPDQPGATQT